DPQVELVEERQSLRERCPLHRYVRSGVAIEDTADHRRVQRARYQTEARAELPAVPEPVAAEHREDVGLIVLKELGGKIGRLFDDGALECVGQPAEEPGVGLVLDENFAADDVAFAEIVVSKCARRRALVGGQPGYLVVEILVEALDR